MLLENLIYGTFPDLPGSQQVVHKTSGISPQVEAELLTFYNEFGDCRNEQFSSSLTVHRLNSGRNESLVSVTKVSQQGQDFSGRWGALLRHSAVMSLEQYQSLFFDPKPVAALLRSGGTAAELGAIGDLSITLPANGVSFLAELLLVPFSDFKENLGRSLSGRRLILYSDTNTDHTNLYLRRLLSLMPFSFKWSLNWSEFAFRSSERLDVALSYSSRYEAPTGPILQFTDSGANSFSRYELHPDFIEDYLYLLEAALTERNIPRLSELICDLPSEATG